MKPPHTIAALAGLLLLASAPSALALGLHSYGAPSYDLNFSTTTYTAPSGSIANPFASEVSITRASVAQTPDSSGHYTQTSSGQPRLSDLGLMIEQARTNKIKNNVNTGAVAGTAGGYTLPTGWQAWTNIPTGLSIDMSLVTDPNTGFACSRWHIYGTTSQAKNTSLLVMGANTDITAAAGDYWISSVFMRRVSGNLPIDLDIYLRTSYYATSSLLGFAGSERLMNRDSTTRRFVTSGLVAPATTNRVKPELVLGNLNNGQVYDFTFDLCVPQTEQVTSSNDNSSTPILTTNAAVTRAADVVTIGGGLLAAIGGSSGTIELATHSIKSGQIDHDLLTVNSSVVMLRRASDGSVSAPGMTGSPATSRSYRPNWFFDQSNVVTWSPGVVTVASSGVGTVGTTANSASPITSATLGADGFVKEFKFWPSAKTDFTPYTTRNGEVVIYGATSGGLAAALAASRQGMRVVWVGAHHEICVGGMTACGGLGQLDMANVARFNGEWISWLQYANEQEGQNTLVTTIPEPRDMATAMYRTLAEAKVTVLFSTGITGVAKNGTRVTSFTTADGIVAKGRVFIDASYEGDLMTRAATSTYGREAGDQSTDANGRYIDFHNGDLTTLGGTSSSGGADSTQFTTLVGQGNTGILTVDPWSTAGDSTSALLQGVQAAPATAQYGSDIALQGYNFRLTLTSSANVRTAFPATPPAGYDRKRYELLARWLKAVSDNGGTFAACCGSLTGTNFGLQTMFKFSGIGKSQTGAPQRGTVYDVNVAEGFSTDYYGSNWGSDFQTILSGCGLGSSSANYALASYAERDCYRRWLWRSTLGEWYWLQYDGLNEVAALSATVAGGGSGCAVGERLVVYQTNTDFPVVLKISSISGSAAATVTVMGGLMAAGQSGPVNPLSIITTSGSCSGATFNLTWGSRLPTQINSDALTMGFVSDYYTEPYSTDDVGENYQLYVREANRMVGMQVAHVNDLSGPDGGAILDGDHVIGMASYAIDSHHAYRRAWQSGGVWKTLNTGQLQIAASSTGVAGGMGANQSSPILIDYITPARPDWTNGFSTFAVSATHEANSALRMEAAFTTDSYAAGLAAAQVVTNPNNIDVQDVDYTALRREIESTNAPSTQLY